MLILGTQNVWRDHRETILKNLTSLILKANVFKACERQSRIIYESFRSHENKLENLKANTIGSQTDLCYFFVIEQNFFFLGLLIHKCKIFPNIFIPSQFLSQSNLSLELKLIPYHWVSSQFLVEILHKTIILRSLSPNFIDTNRPIWWLPSKYFIAHVHGHLNNERGMQWRSQSYFRN